jgi:hypothetical protein
MKTNLKKVLIRDAGNVSHYVEAVKGPAGIELKHSVVVRPCVVEGLTERQAERLVNELAALLVRANDLAAHVEKK